MARVHKYTASHFCHSENWQPVGGQNFPKNSKGLACPPSKDSPIENIGHFHALSNRHLHAAKMLRIALTLGTHLPTPDNRMAAWLDFSKVLAVRLTEEERALLAYWTLRTLPADMRVHVSEGSY